MTDTAEQHTADTPEEAVFRDEVRDFLAGKAVPRRDSGPWVLPIETDREEAKRAFERGRAWQMTLFEHRLAGLTYPTEYGGRGGAPWMERIFTEESAGYESYPGFIASTMAMLGPTLMKHATPEQKAHYLPRLLSGEYGFCQLFSEPGAGSDLAGLGCRAVRDGDEFVVNGQKVWNSAAQFCNWGMLLVRTNPDAPKHKGITFLLVDMSTPGIEVRPLVQPTGGSEFNEVFLNDVRVPVANVIGAIDEGWGAARTVLSNESAFIGGSGSRFTLYNRLLMLADEFDRRSDANVRQDLVRVWAAEKILGLMGERILTAVRRREVPPVDPSILKLSIAMTRAFTGDVAMNIAGPRGIAETAADDELSRWVQFECMGRFMISIGGGTNEVQRNNLAERALGLPKEMRNDHLVPWKDVPRS